MGTKFQPNVTFPLFLIFVSFISLHWISSPVDAASQPDTKIIPDWPYVDSDELNAPKPNLGPEIGEGLAHYNVKARREVINGKDHLIVEGVVVNITEIDISVPLLRVSLLDGFQRRLHKQVISLPVKDLMPRETIPFEVMFSEPSGLARKVHIDFVLP